MNTPFSTYLLHSPPSRACLLGVMLLGLAAATLAEDGESVSLLPEQAPELLLLDGEADVRMSLSGGTVITMPELRTTRTPRVDPMIERMMAIHQDIEAENWAAAIGALRPLLREEPDNMGAHTSAVFVLDKMNRHREAIALLEKMVERFPEDYRVLNNLAWIYATAQDHSLRNVHRAFDLARDALIRAPGDYRVWSTISECYYVSGDFERAEDSMRKTLELAVAANASDSDLRQYRERLIRYRQANAAFQLQS